MSPESPALYHSKFRNIVYRNAITAMAMMALAGRFLSAQVIAPNMVDQGMSEVAVEKSTWLDRTHDSVYNLVWRTAMSIDRLAGSSDDETPYKQASGSVALAVLWSEYHGFEPKARFNVDVPLPEINERVRLVIGRFDRDEYVTERDAPSGAFPRRRNFGEADQTLAGLVYRRPSGTGGDFSASVGSNLNAEIDPYVKGSYSYRWRFWSDTFFRIRETVFWQRSEQFGLTTRIDFERALGRNWHSRFTVSATVSEHRSGVRGYSILTFTRPLGRQSAIAFRLEGIADTSRAVPVRDYGIKAAYRRSIARDWLILELRTDLLWPKEVAGEPRKPSWGFGVGVEMYFGNEEFSSQPVTF